MPKALFIAPHRPGRSPSQRFRFEQYIPYLEKNGWECEQSYLISAENDAAFYSPKNYSTKYKIWRESIKRRASDAARSNEFDIIFIHREALMTGSLKYEKQFAESSAKVIYDFDDSIWLPNVSDSNKNLAWLKDYSKTGKLIEMADLVFAGNNYLKDYAEQFNSNVTIVPTTIDTNEYTPSVKEPNDRICVGWSGSVTTIQHFEYALPIVKALKDIFGNRVYFKIIGSHYSDSELDITGKPWQKATEIHDLNEFDIGIMPLPDDEWANGKCGLKGLQYMALEIPTIMSPVGVNTEIIDHGVNGYLAGSNEEWVEIVSKLFEDKSERERVGAEGRKTVMTSYSKNSLKPHYLSYMNKLIME